jgi:hypothetical protein
MFRGLPGVLALLCFLGCVTIAVGQAAPGPAPTPTATPTIDAQAERLFAQAKDAWRARTDVPYVRYGALIRYLHNGHVFDNWWDTTARSSDGQLDLVRLVDADEDRRRLAGIPFSIFGIKIFDTNRDAEPIRLDEPNILPSASFGIVVRAGAAPETPSPEDLEQDASPDPQSTDYLRTITRVEAIRDYRITLVGTEQLRDGPALHLKLEPLRYPRLNRLRDLWMDPQTHRTMQLNVQGILNGQPYDGILWTVHYVELEGRNYLQQVVADEPLRFGLDTIIPKFEIDFVDYHFPADVPKYTFDKPFSI